MKDLKFYGDTLGKSFVLVKIGKKIRLHNLAISAKLVLRDSHWGKKHIFGMEAVKIWLCYLKETWFYWLTLFDNILYKGLYLTHRLSW